MLLRDKLIGCLNFITNKLISIEYTTNIIAYPRIPLQVVVKINLFSVFIKNKNNHFEHKSLVITL